MAEITCTQEVPAVPATKTVDPPSRTTTDADCPVVLVIEDHPEIRGMVAAVLREAGVEAVEAEGPRAAVELVNDQRFDAAVIGLVMPEISGLDVLRDLRSRPHGRDLRAVFLSVLPQGGARDMAVSKVEALGGCEMLDKPVSPWRLLVSLGRMLAVS